MTATLTWLIRALTWLSLMVSGIASASDKNYAPADLHAYETFVLDNGMRVILNNRGQSPTVTVRLVVGTGLNDYPCHKRELPHLVEHLTFSAYGDYSESELDGMIASWGGAWNAYTYENRTTYDAYVHSDFLQAFSVLLTMMLEQTAFSDDDLETTRAVVHAEAGGVPSAIRQQLYRYGWFEGNAERAYREFAPESSEWCGEIIDATEITRDDVIAYREQQHRADNLTLIVVGKFDVAEFKEVLSYTFGTMPGSPTRSFDMPQMTNTFHGTDYHTRGDALIGQEGYVCLEFGLPHWTHADRATLVMIRSYLETRIFEDLRVANGMSYDPNASINDFSDFSSLMIDASVAIGDMDEAISIMEALVEDLLANGIDEGWIDHIRTAMLFRLASRFESNTSIADFYENGLPILETRGEFIDLENFYADVTTERTLDVANKYLQLDSAMRYTSRPMLSYSGAVIVLLLPFIAFFVFRAMRRRRGQRSEA